MGLATWGLAWGFGYPLYGRGAGAAQVPVSFYVLNLYVFRW